MKTWLLQSNILPTRPVSLIELDDRLAQLRSRRDAAVERGKDLAKQPHISVSRKAYDNIDTELAAIEVALVETRIAHAAAREAYVSEIRLALEPSRQETLGKMRAAFDALLSGWAEMITLGETIREAGGATPIFDRRKSRQTQQFAARLIFGAVAGDEALADYNEKLKLG